MNCALITHRVHKAPIAKGHRQWIEYDRVRDAMRARKAAGFEPRRGGSPVGEAETPKGHQHD